MSVLKIKNGSTWEEIPAGGVGVPSGGNAGDVLVKSSSTDYATQWSAPSNAGCIQMELLWTNPTFSNNSDFNAQTISLDLSDFDAVMIVVRVGNNQSKRELSTLTAMVDGEIYTAFCARTQDNNYGKREFTPTSTGVAVGEGYYGTTQSSSWAVPKAIYGIKGVG